MVLVGVDQGHFQGGDVRCRCRKFVTRGTGAGHHRVIRIIRTTSCDFGQSGYPLLSPHVVFLFPNYGRLLLWLLKIVVCGSSWTPPPRDHRSTGTSAPYVRVPHQISYIWTMITALTLP